MVSAYLADALRDPTSELKELYSSNISSTHFPLDVSRHFSTVFASDEAFKEIPILDVHHPPHSHRDGSLVRFRGMIQDTSPSSEMYLSKFKNGSMGGWGIYDEVSGHDGQNVEYSDLRECNVLWAISVPGESPWCARELDGQSSSDTSYRSPFPHKYPSPDEGHVVVQVKMYDMSTAEKLKTTDLVTFVGILVQEPDSVEADAPVNVPTLHVLFTRLHEGPLVSRPYPLSTQLNSSALGSASHVRQAMITWVANQSLGGDEEAAEWIILAIIARVQSRNPPLLPPTLTISHFPSPPRISASTDVQAVDSASPPATPTLSHILSHLLPVMRTLRLSLDVLNKASFVPESKDEDLHSGVLQLPHGSTLLVTESGIQEGKLVERALLNINALQEVMATQSLGYQFPFSRFSFPTDIKCIILTEGKKSTFFKTDISIPLIMDETKADPSALYKPMDSVDMPLEDELAAFRDLIIGSQSGKVQVSSSVSEYIQKDFVDERQRNPAITSDDLIRRMTIAKLYALSLHETELSVDVWERAKILDERRKSRSA